MFGDFRYVTVLWNVQIFCDFIGDSVTIAHDIFPAFITEVDEYLQCPQVSDESQMMPYASHPASSSMADQLSTENLEKWDDKHVRLLIECYLKYKDLFGKAQHTKKKVFDKIAE